MRSRSALRGENESIARLNKQEIGFSLLSVIVSILLLGFIAAVILKLLSVWIAVIGFILASIAVLFLVSLPDIIRYGRISTM